MPYSVTCPSMSTDPGSLKPGTRRSRVPWWWDPGIRTNAGAGDTVLANTLNLYYSTSSWKLFSYPFSGILCQSYVVSSTWKQRPVIRSPAHNPLLFQLPILLHSMTQTDMKVIKTEFTKLWWGFHLHSPLITIATSTLLLVRTVLCVFRLSDCWIVPIGMRHRGNYI